jgi:hypothetical protein
MCSRLAFNCTERCLFKVEGQVTHGYGVNIVFEKLALETEKQKTLRVVQLAEQLETSKLLSCGWNENIWGL